MAQHLKNCNKNVCNCVATTTASQSLDELEFERGIWTAALDGDMDRLEKLIHKGDVNRRDNFGYTALHYASRKNNYEVCKFLLQSGADVNAKTKSGGVTSLHRAAMMGYDNILQLLLNCGAYADMQDDDGNTALHKAAQNRHYETVKILLNHNANLKHCANNKNQTAYDLTSEQLRLLLQ